MASRQCDSRRLETVPDIGFIAATVVAAKNAPTFSPAGWAEKPEVKAATVGDAQAFRPGRQFAAWLGLVPKKHSSEGKGRMEGTSKTGDRYLRHLLVVGATAVIRYMHRKTTMVTTPAKDAVGLVCSGHGLAT